MNWKYKLPATQKIALKMGMIALLLAQCFIGRVEPVAARTQSPAETPSHADPRFAIADFDGDLRPDLAIVEAGQAGTSESRYWIRFELSTGAKQAVAVRAPVGGIQLSSRDVNGDNVIDLVVSTNWLNRPVAVLLNDGRGNFTIADPAKFAEAFRETDPHSGYSRAEWNEARVVVSTRARTQHLEAHKGLMFGRESSYAIVTQGKGFAKRQMKCSKRGRAPPDFCHHV